MGSAVDMSGAIEAIQSELRTDPNLYALAINHSRYVEARNCREVNGRILLSADGGVVESSGRLSAPGGDVAVLADVIQLCGEATVDVSSSKGGGTALIGGSYHNEDPTIPTASFLTIEKKGSRSTQTVLGRAVVDRHLIEVSGHGPYSIAWATLLTAAPFGRDGWLSFDPVNVAISTDPDSGIASSPPPGYVFDGSAGSWNINTANLQNFLANNNVEINTSSISRNDPGGSGNIDVNNSFTWTSDNILNIVADGTMTVGDGVIILGGGNSGTASITANSGHLDFVLQSGKRARLPVIAGSCYKAAAT